MQATNKISLGTSVKKETIEKLENGGKTVMSSPTPCHTNVVSGDVHREPGSCPLIVFDT